MLSDVVGERITHWREVRGWSRRELADKCSKIDPKLTFESIANIESGRRKDGVRRRTITIDELVVLAFVLNVPPAALLSTYPEEEQTELFPGEEVVSYAPLLWFSGKRFPYHSTYRAPYGRIDEFIAAAEPLQLIMQHEELFRQRAEAAGRFRQAASDTPGTFVYGRMHEIADRHEDDDQQQGMLEILRVNLLLQVEKIDIELLELRDEFRKRGYPLPSLPKQIRYLEDQAADKYERMVSMDLVDAGDGFKVMAPAAKAKHEAYARVVLMDEEEL